MYNDTFMAYGVVIFCLCVAFEGVSARSFADLQVRSKCSDPSKMPTILNCNPCQYEIAIISDNDENSKSKTKAKLWNSKYVRTTIKLESNNMSFSLGTIRETILSSSLNSEGLGMELSELIYFKGNLLTFDDKTGIIYKIVDNHVQPWIKLISCEGSADQTNFKAEWSTVKDKHLYVGSTGYSWSSSDKNEIEPNCGPQWIKIISADGTVQDLKWKTNFDKVKAATKCKGYITHESVDWSDVHKKWFFAPRKCSENPFDPKTDNKKGANILISADENFEKIKVVEIGREDPNRGFSSFKFLPHSEDTIIVGLKTFENDTALHSYITIFDMEGKIYLDDYLISKVDKFEGVEFLHQ